MYRGIILEFLSTNRSNLLENNYSQMTLVLFPYELKNIQKLDNEISNVKIYHIKEPYTFLKEYEFSKLQNTIIEMILEYKETIKINKSDISFEIFDPYYLKDIRNQDFMSLEINPIINNGDLIGVSILYSNNLNSNFNISNKKWITLVNKLIIDEEKSLYENIENNIKENENWLYVVKNNNKFFINEELRKKHRFNNNIISEKEHDYFRLNKIIQPMTKIICEENEIYYIPNHLLKNENDNLEILMFESINNHSFKDDFTVIFTKMINDDETSNKDVNKYILKYHNAIKKIYPDSIIKTYKIDDNTIALVLDKAFKKKDENELRYIIKKDYFIVMSTSSNITKSMNIIDIINFLNETLPDTFIMDKYLEYSNKLNQSLYEVDKNLHRYNKILIKADTLQTIGHMVNAPINDYYNIATYKLIENKIVNVLEKVIKDNINNPIITLLIDLVSKRKVYELLKKIINKEPNAKIIIHVPKIQDYDTGYIYNLIQKLKDLGYIIIIDSTIFMNFKYSVCLKISDAIIIRNDELDSSLTHNNLFNKKIFESFYENSKVVIFEKIPKEEDIEIINELTCLLIDNN